jgi:hypothetical protein
MMLMYPGPDAEKGAMPTAEKIAAMMKYNVDLTEAGVLIALDGLQSTSKGARVTFYDGKAEATDGPFTESKEILGGFWMINVASKEEAVAWALKCPGDGSEMIELRQVFEMSDFAEETRDFEAEKVVSEALGVELK